MRCWKVIEVNILLLYYPYPSKLWKMTVEVLGIHEVNQAGPLLQHYSTGGYPSHRAITVIARHPCTNAQNATHTHTHKKRAKYKIFHRKLNVIRASNRTFAHILCFVIYFFFIAFGPSYCAPFAPLYGEKMKSDIISGESKRKGIKILWKGHDCQLINCKDIYKGGPFI